MHLPVSIFWVASAEKVAGFQPGRFQTEPSTYSILLMMTFSLEPFSGLSPAFAASTTLEGASGLNNSNCLLSFGFALTTQKNCRSKGSGTSVGWYCQAKLFTALALVFFTSSR